VSARLKPVPCENLLCCQPMKPYRRNGVIQRFCKPACAYAFRRAHPRHFRHNLGPANAAIQHRRRQQMVAEFYGQFGELSVRELEIIKLALAKGYARGYWKAITRMRREERAA
jgi:hypothetical protein